MNQTLDIRIREQQDALTKCERLVATAVLLHQQDLAQFSLDDLANLVGVSKATVARFFKALGYTSYREARYEKGLPKARALTPLSMMSAYEHASKKIDPTLVNHIQLEVTNLSRTAQEIDPELINETTQALSNATRIWVLGMRTQYPLALYAQLTFSHFANDVRVVSATGNITLDVVSMRKGDVLFAIGSRRRTKEFKLVMKNARELGLKVILISDLTATESLKYADIVLRCHCRGYLHDTHTTFISLVSFIGAAIELQKGHDHVRRLKYIEQLHEQLGHFGRISDKF